MDMRTLATKFRGLQIYQHSIYISIMLRLTFLLIAQLWTITYFLLGSRPVHVVHTFAVRHAADYQLATRLSLRKLVRALVRSVWRYPTVKFLGVGGFCALLQVACLLALVNTGLIAEIPASAASYLFGALINYVLNYYVTFASSQNHHHALPKFMLVVAIGLLLNTGIFALVERVSHWYLLSQFVATAAATTMNFTLHKLWIYRQGGQSRHAAV